jgi:uncharacterized delta-60 repeat protein
MAKLLPPSPNTSTLMKAMPMQLFNWNRSPIRWIHSWAHQQCMLRAVALCALTMLLSACGGGGTSEPGVRFNYPSVIDSSFGVNGYRISSTGLSAKQYLQNFAVNDFLVDQQGRFVVVGSRTSSNTPSREAWFYRMQSDGTPDTSCGSNGFVAISTNGPAVASKVLQLPDGRYVIGGNLGLASLRAIKADCSLDTSFGVAGVANMPAPSPLEIQDGVNALGVDASGNMVATVASTLSGKLLMAKFSSNGALDLTFGTGQGYVSFNPPDGATARPSALVIRPDGRVLVATSMQYNLQSGYWAGLVQLKADGSVDTGYGDNGFVSIRVGQNLLGQPHALVLLPDGSAIQSGLTQPGVLAGTLELTDAYWLKVDANGQADTAFGNTGILVWTAGPTGKQRSSNYAKGMLLDGANVWTCQNWLNNTTGDFNVLPQTIVQLRSSSSGALQTAYGMGGTGWLARQTEAGASCTGMRRGQDGKVYALLDYSPPETTAGQAFALVRLL